MTMNEHGDDGDVEGGHDGKEAVVPVQPATSPLWEAGTHDEYDGRDGMRREGTTATKQ
jgi:hypothetical protein